MIRTRAPLAVTLLSVTPALAGVPVAVDPAEIPNYQVVRPGLAFGGQPARQSLDAVGLHSPSMWEAVLRVLGAVPVAPGVNP